MKNEALNVHNKQAGIKDTDFFIRSQIAENNIKKNYYKQKNVFLKNNSKNFLKEPISKPKFGDEVYEEFNTYQKKFINEFEEKNKLSMSYYENFIYKLWKFWYNIIKKSLNLMSNDRIDILYKNIFKENPKDFDREKKIMMITTKIMMTAVRMCGSGSLLFNCLMLCFTAIIYNLMMHYTYKSWANPDWRLEYQITLDKTIDKLKKRNDPVSIMMLNYARFANRGLNHLIRNFPPYNARLGNNTHNFILFLLRLFRR